MIFSDEKSYSDALILSLQEKFTLTKEEDVSTYLGVQLDISQVTMSQSFLIEKFINSLGDAIYDANVKDNPAVFKEILHKDSDGSDRKESWNYRSLIRVLNYLAASTCPDVSFVVHQCTRFSTSPKLSHKRSVKRIVRYLRWGGGG